MTKEKDGKAPVDKSDTTLPPADAGDLEKINPGQGAKKGK